MTAKTYSATAVLLVSLGSLVAVDIYHVALAEDTRTLLRLLTEGAAVAAGYLYGRGRKGDG